MTNRNEYKLYEGKTLYCFKDENGEERRFATREQAENMAEGKQVYTIEYHHERQPEAWDTLHDDIQKMDTEELEAVTRQFLPRTERAKRYGVEWDKKNTVQIKMKLNKTNDADILEKLESVPNKQGYIKELIRRDLGE